MKKAIICGSAVIIFGLLIGLGPQFLFKVCSLAAMSTEAAAAAPTETAEAAETSTDSCGVGGGCGSGGCGGGTAESFPICHWSARAEIGIGLLIVAPGAMRELPHFKMLPKVLT